MTAGKTITKMLFLLFQNRRDIYYTRNYHYDDAKHDHFQKYFNLKEIDKNIDEFYSFAFRNFTNCFSHLTW